MELNIQNSTRLKHVLLISFEIRRSDNLNLSYAIGSLISFAHAHKTYGDEFVIHPIDIDPDRMKNGFCPDLMAEYLACFRMDALDTIAIGTYIWNEHLINPLLMFLRHQGFDGKIVLGGPQITYAEKNKLNSYYPYCDIFISGYGELSLVKAIRVDKPTSPLLLNEEIDFTQLPSTYTSGVLQIPQKHKMVRMETQRGCPYRCSFCAHRDLERNRVYKHALDKVFDELSLFRRKNVQKVNLLDPVFNLGNRHLEVMEEIEKMRFENTLFSFQARLELIPNKRGERFLELAEIINSHLEFGLQSIIPSEYSVVNRNNDPKLVTEALERIADLGISYEVSLIYGLPTQTVDSFKRSIEYLKSKRCTKITAYPLMLLRGTELSHERDKWDLKERVINDYNIPVVVSSNSFSEDDWFQMKEIADVLSPNERV